MGRTFLVTYRPVCSTNDGLRAIEKYGLAPFIDASCRREPDFESKWPTITALCRGRNFAPRLKVGDRAVYITKQMNDEWYLTAILEVVQRFESHEEAAAWFRSQHLPLPSNLMVDGNPPQPIDRTGAADYGSLKIWDGQYKARADRYGAVLACEPLFLNLHTPPRITRAEWEAWNGGVPATRTPTDRSDLWGHLWRATSNSSNGSAPRGRRRSVASRSGRATISSASTTTSPRKGC